MNWLMNYYNFNFPYLEWVSNPKRAGEIIFLKWFYLSVTYLKDCGIKQHLPSKLFFGSHKIILHTFMIFIGLYEV